jgi:hypothetical protein
MVFGSSRFFWWKDEHTVVTNSMSPTKVYISRNFTEFGPFTKEEIIDFTKRGIIGKKDFVRIHNHDTWIHADEWVKNAIAGEPNPAVPVATAQSPAAAPAKKAAKKAAKKSAKKAAKKSSS